MSIAAALDLVDVSLEPERLRTAFAEVLASERFPVPPLPNTIMELNALASQEEPNLMACCDVVERDAALAARVLALASSAAFGTRAATNLRQAVVRLGINGLRDLAFALCIGEVFRGPRTYARWMHEEHSRAYLFGRAFSAACRQCECDTALCFLAGLLADIGRLALVALLAELGRGGTLPPRHELLVLVDDFHVQAGEATIRRWELADELALVARWHHAPAAGAALCGADDPRQAKMLHAACACDWLLESAAEGYAVLSMPLVGTPAAAAGLGHEQLPLIVEAIETARIDVDTL